MQTNISQDKAANSNSLVWFITGCSSGFGRALVEAALAHGYKVVATARKIEQIKDFEQQYPDTALALALDVTQPNQVHEAVNKALSKFETIDVLVNNAGFGMIGAVEEVPDAQTRHLFDTNVFGLLSVTRAVLPIMRDRHQGHILNISSVGGFVSVVGSGIYCASKFAVEGLSEALAQEIAPMGIHLTIVEPGPFRTNFAGDSITKVPPMDAYAETVGKRREQVDQMDGKQPGDPVCAAEAMIQVVETANPPLRLVLGKSAVQAIRRKLDTVAQDLNTWEETSLSADFPN